jgi:hypothetical protein
MSYIRPHVSSAKLLDEIQQKSLLDIYILSKLSNTVGTELLSSSQLISKPVNVYSVESIPHIYLPFDLNVISFLLLELASRRKWLLPGMLLRVV